MARRRPRRSGRRKSRDEPRARLTRRFLTAEWRWLAMLNYRVDPGLLAPHLPVGTALDLWRGSAFVSLVGFHFRRTRLLGVPIPWHTTFEEVNLRFYVRRVVGREVRRGVVFIRELVPRRAIAVVARLRYNEPYEALPMRHRIELTSDAPDQSARNATRGSAAEGETLPVTPREVAYAWRRDGRWHELSVAPTGVPRPAAVGSEAEFITEHYWGYTRQRDGGTVEYQVEHPRWQVWDAPGATLDADTAPLYGEAFAEVLRAPPDSALLADGSPIVVYAPRRLPERP